MANFTKGEWSIEHYDTFTGIHSKGVVIADVNTAGCVPLGEELANAALIAAAPDMYAMLEKLITSGTELLNIEEVSSEEDAATIHANFNDDLLESLRRLKKARGE